MAYLFCRQASLTRHQCHCSTDITSSFPIQLLGYHRRSLSFVLFRRRPLSSYMPKNLQGLNFFELSSSTDPSQDSSRPCYVEPGRLRMFVLLFRQLRIC